MLPGINLEAMARSMTSMSVLMPVANISGSARPRKLLMPGSLRFRRKPGRIPFPKISASRKKACRPCPIVNPIPHRITPGPVPKRVMATMTQTGAINTASPGAAKDRWAFSKLALRRNSPKKKRNHHPSYAFTILLVGAKRFSSQSISLR